MIGDARCLVGFFRGDVSMGGKAQIGKGNPEIINKRADAGVFLWGALRGGERTK